MKKYIILIILFAITRISFAQDQTINGNLTINKALTVGSQGTPNSTGSVERLTIAPYGHTGRWIFSVRDIPGTAFLDLNYGSNKLLTINHDKKIGILTDNPQYSLDVNGTFFAKDAHFGNNAPGSASNFIIRGPNNPFGTESKRDISFEYVAAGKSIIRTFRGNSFGNYMQFLTTDDSGATPKVRLHIDKSGNIAIGSEIARYMLDVAGTIRAKEVKIETSAGADHVFYPSYALMPLSEVESFVKENKHLPEIPSEKQMVEEGLNVNEMQIKLLQKIEELTLYVIDLKKENEGLQKRVQQLEKNLP